jgi:GH24 family phage-related lysozyme (muramidase)
MCREGVALGSYRDSVGVWTIGVGHTAAAGEPYPVPGRKITLAEAFEVFQRDVAKYESAVIKAVKVPLKQHEYDAFVSICFNIGQGGFAKSSMVKSVNRGDRAQAARDILKWNKPPEIMGRRASEEKQFRTGDYGDIRQCLVWLNPSKSGLGKSSHLPTAGLFSETQGPPASQQLPPITIAPEQAPKPSEPDKPVTAPPMQPKEQKFWPAFIEAVLSLLKRKK